MIYAVHIETLPKVVNSYTVVRKTVWQVAYPYHILLIILNGECMIEWNNKTYKLIITYCFVSVSSFFESLNFIFKKTVSQRLMEKAFRHASVAFVPVCRKREGNALAKGDGELCQSVLQAPIQKHTAPVDPRAPYING